MPNAAILLVAFVVALILGRPAIYLLRRWGCGQQVRDDGPPSHLVKTGTPTMGGVIIIIALIVGVAVGLSRLHRALTGHSAWAVIMLIGLTVAFGLVGFMDDRAIMKHKRSLGLRARHKLALQFALAAGFLYLVREARLANAVVTIPFTHWMLTLGWWYYPGAVILIVLTSNSVNLSDGLDGLAAGLAAMAAVAMGVVATWRGEPALGGVCYALCGACLGFLWYNAHPARIFMGDTGALALGAALAGAAIMLRAELLLLIVGVIFYVEALSVIAQVAYFRLTGKRILRMSPLHHHFELSGWTEPQIVVRMWVIGGLVGWGAITAYRWLPL